MNHLDSSSGPDDSDPQATASAGVTARAGPGGGGVGGYALVVSAYEAQHAALYAFLVRATRDRAVAEDLLQEAYLRLANEIREGRRPGDVRAWLYRVASGLVIARGGRRTLFGGRGRAKDGADAPAPGRGSLGHERAGELERVLQGLSQEARLALLLSAEGFRGDEIAGALERSPAAARTLLGRARARVRLRRDLYAEAGR